MIYRYFSILLASVMLLAGLQVPGFVNQYEQRIDAHLAEVRHNLSGFQRIADQFHGGSLLALIEKHRQSQDETFSAEAVVLTEMYERRIRFEAELKALEASLVGRVSHVLFAADREMLRETADNYTYTINLTKEAAICAAVALFAGILASDTIRLLLGSLFHRRKTGHSRL